MLKRKSRGTPYQELSVQKEMVWVRRSVLYPEAVHWGIYGAGGLVSCGEIQPARRCWISFLAEGGEYRQTDNFVALTLTPVSGYSLFFFQTVQKLTS